MLVDIVTPHLRSMLHDIETYYIESPVPARYKSLYDAGIIALHELILACEANFVNRNVTRLHQDLITVGLNFIARWEIWIDTLSYGSLKSAASKTFHEYLMRFFKGALKAYRIWLIDRNK